MDQTKVLHVLPEYSLGNNIIIHPNDGADLGLLMYSLKVKIYANSTIEEFNKDSTAFHEGELKLENKCKSGSVVMGKKYWEKVGKPENVKLFISKEKLLIAFM